MKGHGFLNSLSKVSSVKIDRDTEVAFLSPFEGEILKFLTFPETPRNQI